MFFSSFSEKSVSPYPGPAPQSPWLLSTPLFHHSSQIMASMMWLKPVMERLVFIMLLVCVCSQVVSDSFLACTKRWLILPFKVYVTQWQPFSAPAQGKLNPQTVQEKLQVIAIKIPSNFPSKFHQSSRQNSRQNFHKKIPSNCSKKAKIPISNSYNQL